MDTPTTITQIGKYQILGVAGVGGMGVVYRGEDKFIGREVAIKTLNDTTPELRKRFLDEARSGFLSHQNIVTLYDFGEHDGSPYIVMEFLNGESLEKLERSGKPLSLVDKLDMMRQVCEGLGYAHSKGVVHRDIKPANVMVQPDGHIKIVDFGIARLQNSSGNTQTGAVIGTFHYIAPERLKGDPSDGRADIWSVGVMLYQLLTGRLPFGGEDISALHKVVNEPFEPLSATMTNYPPALDQVMQHALAKSPEDRYQTAEEMASDLEAINEVLKRAQVNEKLNEVSLMVEQEQFNSARTALTELQRLDPANTQVKRLLREVQEKLSRQQRSEQVRQLTLQAEEAALNQKYADAIDCYKQATKLDPGNGGLAEKIEHLRGLKERADRVAWLRDQAQEAKGRDDLPAARRSIEQALELDDRDTSLRNELVLIVQEMERAAKEDARRKLLAKGKEKVAGRQYTEAIQTLREALQMNPTDGEAQQLYQDAVTRQEEDRRRKVIEQIVAEIQECVTRRELDRALELIQRAIEKAPGEPALLRLKAETERAQREAFAQALVEQTAQQVQELIVTEPQQALECAQAALEKLPGDPRLIALQGQAVERLKKANLEALRGQSLQRAQEALDAHQFDKAIQILEAAEIDCGQGEEISYLLGIARREKQKEALEQQARAAVQKAQALIGQGNLEAAIALLQPVAEQGGSAEAAQLLRQTTANLAEIQRRIDAVVSRAQALAGQDPAQALQLIQAQPAAIQQHPRVTELRVDLEKRIEREGATAEAVRRSQEYLAANDLAALLEPLEDVQRRFGENPAVSAALADLKAKRAQIANAMLADSINAAKQCLLAQQPARAVQAIETYARFVTFADAASQAEWNRVAQESGKAAGVKSISTGTSKIAVKGKGPGALVWGGLGLAVLAIGAAVAWYFAGPTLVGPTTYLSINAAPFAEVVSVTSDKGKQIALPAGDHTTPLRLEGLPVGSYDVQFKLPSGEVRTRRSCGIDESTHLCALNDGKDMTESQIDAIVAGQK
jgi:serine/threonine-protein kinase